MWMIKCNQWKWQIQSSKLIRSQIYDELKKVYMYMQQEHIWQSFEQSQGLQECLFDYLLSVRKTLFIWSSYNLTFFYLNKQGNAKSQSQISTDLF